MRTIITIAMGIILAVPLYSGDGWVFRKESKGIKSYTRPVKGWKVHQTRGVGKVHAPFDRVVTARLDFNRFFSNNPNMSSFKILKSFGPYRKIIYAVIDVPWPASDRDVIFEVKVRVSRDQVTTMSRSIPSWPGAPSRVKGLVRMPKMEEKHVFTRMKDGTTHVLTESLADPGGTLPKGIINLMLADAPINTIRTIRKIVANYPAKNR